MAAQSISELSSWIKKRAGELGFNETGISKACFLESDAHHLQNWLNRNFHGDMQYMENYIEKRSDPRKLIENARSVISVILNYTPDKTISTENNYKISRYAYGKDYHYVIRDKLNILIGELQEKEGPLQARAFTDSAPVLDRAWAKRAGLGWIGKNSCLIHPKYGSYLFIGEIITDLELEYNDGEIKDFCGGCTKCIENCPTAAILSPGFLDSRKCISYQSIESRKEIPPEFKDKMNDYIFGCDICQEVCPWNRIAKGTGEQDFQASDMLMKMNKNSWKNIDKAKFNELFQESAVQRTRFKGLKRNIDFLQKEDE